MSNFNANQYNFPNSTGGSSGTIPMTNYNYGTGNANQVAQAGGTRPDSNASQVPDLVTYIASSLPVSIKPNHVLMGLGVTFAGVVGGIIYWKSRERNDADAVYTESELALEKSLAGIGAGRSRLSIPDGVLILHQCPRGRRTPCIAPYPLKLETFLRVYGIKYEIDIDGTKTVVDNNNKGERESVTNKGAYLTIDLEETQDTQNSVKFICEKYNIDPQKYLDERQKSLERAFLHLLEHHIYWGISLYRWVYDGARSIEKIQYLPPATVNSIPNVCRTVEQAAWFHGIGKKAPAEVVEDILRDLASMSRLLGEKKFFLSNNYPSELDCTAFAMLAQMYWTMEESPYYHAISTSYKNLADFCERIKQEFWPDWEQCLNNTPVLS